MNKKNILHVCTFHCSRRVIRRLIIRSRPFVDCRVYRQRQRALAFLAGLPHRHVVDIISQNQERLIRSEAIVEALGGNPLTGRAVVERILALYGDEDEEEAAVDEHERQRAARERAARCVEIKLTAPQAIDAI